MSTEHKPYPQSATINKMVDGYQRATRRDNAIAALRRAGMRTEWSGKAQALIAKVSRNAATEVRHWQFSKAPVECNAAEARLSQHTKIPNESLVDSGGLTPLCTEGRSGSQRRAKGGVARRSARSHGPDRFAAGPRLSSHWPLPPREPSQSPMVNENESTFKAYLTSDTKSFVHWSTDRSPKPFAL
jgi:hypothetical protein